MLNNIWKEIKIKPKKHFNVYNQILSAIKVACERRRQTWKMEDDSNGRFADEMMTIVDFTQVCPIFLNKYDIGTDFTKGWSPFVVLMHGRVASEGAMRHLYLKLKL